MAIAVFQVDTSLFKQQALRWAQQFNELCFFQSNGYNDHYAVIDSLLAVGAQASFTAQVGTDTFRALEIFKAEHPHCWMPGFFSYDLKNEIEDLQTLHSDRLDFPEAYFFVPKVLLHFEQDAVKIDASDPAAVYKAILDFDINTLAEPLAKDQKINFRTRMSKQAYMEAFQKLIGHIQQGDIYEVNLCQEFFAEDVTIDPLAVYEKLNSISPTPFSCFFKKDSRYILSASPERFLAKRGQTIISQPIKGTAPRGKNAVEDLERIDALRNNPKEIAENVMIVDLVRNDLTRSAAKGTVKAEKQLEVQTFQQVHQLVSTVSCRQKEGLSDVEVIRNTFPAGSMTGAPKISAMRLCDRYEASKRGIYAGTVGYFAPNGDFDFNVVIRSLLYNREEGYLSFHTGGALTMEAEAEKEYAECLLKASAILRTLDAKLTS